MLIRYYLISSAVILGIMSGWTALGLKRPHLPSGGSTSFSRGLGGFGGSSGWSGGK